MIPLSFQIRKAFLQGLFFIMMGFSCYLYTLFGSDFAEWRVTFPFLNFPIFIGELLLIVSMFIVLAYSLKSPVFTDKIILFLFIVYVLWVLTKALVGYVLGGPLSLRTAALFYYPFFAFAGCVLFDKNLLDVRWRYTVTVFLVLNLFFVPGNDYFLPVFWVLALGLFFSCKTLWIKWPAILLLFVNAFYSKVFFAGSRSHLIGTAVMFLFLIGYFLFGFLKIHWRIKMWAAIVLAIVAMICFFNFADQNAIRSMLSFQHLRQQFIGLDADIQRRMKDYVPWELKSQIYYQNHGGPLTDVLHHYFLSAQQTFLSQNNLLSDREIIMIDDSTKDLIDEAVEVRESVINQKADLIDQKNRVMKDPNKGAVIEQPAQDLDTALGRFPQKPGNHEEKDSIELLQNSSLASQSKPERTNEGLPKAVDDSSLSTAAKFKETVQQKQESIAARVIEQKVDRSLEVAVNNTLFRLFIWRDMFQELITQKAWWGMSFGHPQRSISIEILNWASTEWRRDGWITPHNSFLHMIYRGGVVGLFCVFAIIGSLIYLTVGFLKHRSVWGGLLVACLMYWVGISNFLVFLELPYNAIPFWTFFGTTLAYYHSLEKTEILNG